VVCRLPFSVICHTRAAGSALRFRCARIKPYISQLTTTFYGSRSDNTNATAIPRSKLSLSFSLSLFLSFSAGNRRRNVNCIRKTEAILYAPAFANSMRTILDSIAFDSLNRDFLSLSLSLSSFFPRQRGNYGSFLITESFGNFATFCDSQQSSRVRVICRG